MGKLFQEQLDTPHGPTGRAYKAQPRTELLQVLVQLLTFPWGLGNSFLPTALSLPLTSIAYFMSLIFECHACGRMLKFQRCRFFFIRRMESLGKLWPWECCKPDMHQFPHVPKQRNPTNFATRAR